MSKRVALYVSGHGFGHAVRCAEVARALLDRGARVLLRTDAPRWLFPAEVEPLAPPAGSDPGPLDVGVAQRDGLDLDVDETRDRWRAFERVFAARADEEARALRAAGVHVLLGDVPPLAFEAAARADLPSLALANFGWDDIYAPWTGFETAIARVREAYARADALLRLPLHVEGEPSFAAFRVIHDVPLIARVAKQPRARIRALLDIPAAQPTVLLSFGGFDVSDLDLAALGRWRDYLFLATTPLPAGAARPSNLRQIPDHLARADYPSVLAACDAVVTKPGYGIVADCLVNRVALLYTDRGPFREYDVLARALERLGRARYIPRDDVRAGRLGPHLDALCGTTASWADLRTDGAQVVADRVLVHATLGPEPSGGRSPSLV